MAFDAGSQRFKASRGLADDLCADAKTRSPQPPFWCPDQALSEALAALDAGWSPRAWRPITDSTAADRGGFNIAKQGEDR